MAPLTGGGWQLLAGDTPHILCGDFNFRPESSMYRLVTTGVIEEDHPEYPEVPDDMWKPTIRTPLKSAYL